MSTFLVFEVHLFLIDSFDIFHDAGSSGRPNREPSDAADNEDTSDLSKCHKEFRVVFVPRGQQLKLCTLRKKQKQSRHVVERYHSDTLQINFQKMKSLIHISITTAVLI